MNKKLLAIFIFLCTLLPILSSSGLAQKYPTRFLGFPVDGPKEKMIENLESVGFTYNSDEDFFTGYYFGEPVYVVLKIRDRRVNRVLLYDIVQRDSFAIKKRFNKMYKVYRKNKKYVYMEDKDAHIAKDENITIGISHYSRKYKVVFGQKPYEKGDSVSIQERALKPLKGIRIDNDALKTNMKERLRRIHAKALARSVSTTDDRFMNQVWFAISEKFGKYALIHSFDNLYNFTQPEDEEK